MNKLEMGELLGELQGLFDIREDLRIDFTSESGQFHSARVMNAMKKHGITPSIETISALFEQFEKTPPTGAKMVDALIVEIIGAAEGDVQPAEKPTSFAGCGLCHDGTVTLPLPGGRDGVVSNRAVYCDCGRGQFLWNANKNTSICLLNRPDLKAKAFAIQREERARAGSTLIRFGVDPDADEETQNRQFRQAFKGMKQRIGINGVTAKTVKPPTASEARAMLADARKRHEARPPEQLDPEALAVAVYQNGDERNEWDWS